jgi:hypothetical protein
MPTEMTQQGDAPLIRISGIRTTNSCSPTMGVVAQAELI